MNRAVLLVVVLLSGCYAEGHSYWLADGPTERFLTMGRCLAEANATHPDGSRLYAGYECRSKLLGFTLEKVRIAD